MTSIIKMGVIVAASMILMILTVPANSFGFTSPSLQHHNPQHHCNCISASSSFLPTSTTTPSFPFYLFHSKDRKRRATVAALAASVTQLSAKDEDNENDDSSTTSRTTTQTSTAPPPAISTELWLDLRGTAIDPNAAIDYLLEEDTEWSCGGSEDATGSGSSTPAPNTSPLINRILVSDTMMQKIIDNNNNSVEPSLLYIPEESNNMLVESRTDEDNAYGMSFPIGQIQYLPNNLDASMIGGDPMAAMDTVSKGQWIALIDDEKAKGDDSVDDDSKILSTRINAISGFVDIVSAAAATTSTAASLESGLLLGGSDSLLLDGNTDDNGINNDDDDDSRVLILPNTNTILENPLAEADSGSGGGGSTGGIAISCTSKTMIVEIASIYHSLLQQSGVGGIGTTTTESGILIPTSPTSSEEEESDSTNRSSNMSSSSNDGDVIKTAILLPFDVMLWRTAWLLFRGETYL